MAQDPSKIEPLINNVMEFLPRVKKFQLDKKARKLKATIEQQVKELRIDNVATDTNSEVISDTIYEETGGYGDIQAEDILKQKVPASDNTKVIYQGKLKYMKEKNKRWCVLRDQIFYIYERASSKKQEECFFVKGYQVTPMDKGTQKRNPIFPFEMVQENKKTYVFFAQDEKEQKEWVRVLNVATGIECRERPLTTIEALYDDMDALINEKHDSCTPSGGSYTDFENTYSAMDGDDMNVEPDRDTAYEDGELLYDETMPAVSSGSALDATAMEEPPMLNPNPGYADMYYGLLDSESDYPQELGFKRGDIITILSRQYEDKGWWVGMLDDRIGLVPVSYLAPAFERVVD